MKDYELSVLFHPDLEMNQDPAIDKVKKLIKSAGGNIKNEENEGKKRLAYSINGQDFGVYYYFDLQLPAEAGDTYCADLMNVAETQMDASGACGFGKTIVRIILVIREVILPVADQ